MKRDIADDVRFAGHISEGQYFDIATPYGYGGWLIEGMNTKDLFFFFYAKMQSMGIISEFVRFHPIINNHIACTSFYEVIQLGEVIHMDLSSPEKILDNITSKNRNHIRKAKKNGIKIYNGRFKGVYNKFNTIYNATMDKDEADDYYYFKEEFYNSILDDLRHFGSS